MKKHKYIPFILLTILYIGVFVTSIVFLFLKQFGNAIFFSIPLFFLFPVFLTFYKVPKNPNKHIFLFILTILIRYLCDVALILIPTLIWYYIPQIKENTSSLMVLVPFLELFVVYNITIIFYIVDSKQEIQRMNKNEL